MKKKDSCIQQLEDYLRKNDGWHKKVHLFVLGDDWGFSPETIARKLRILAEGEDPVLSVSYYDGKHSKGLAMYAYGRPKQEKTRVEVVDGTARIIKYYE